MSKANQRVAKWLFIAGLLPTGFGIWLMREAVLVAPHDPQHGGAMLFVSGLVFAVPGALMIIIAVVLRLVSWRQSGNAEPAA